MIERREIWEVGDDAGGVGRVREALAFAFAGYSRFSAILSDLQKVDDSQFGCFLLIIKKSIMEADGF
jgi:hypothetical protein